MKPNHGRGARKRFLRSASFCSLLAASVIGLAADRSWAAAKTPEAETPETQTPETQTPETQTPEAKVVGGRAAETLAVEASAAEASPVEIRATETTTATKGAGTGPVGEAPSSPTFRLSGYVQGRFEYHSTSADGLTDAGKAGATTQFLVRRGRVKVSHESRLAAFALQIDATPRGVTLKDAEATFIEPWTGLGLRWTVGQFKWPFGDELQQSSSAREMPERSRVVRTLFPGERDRGLRMVGRWEWMRFALAVVNGNGTTDPIYGAHEENAFKDVVGRVGVEASWWTVGVSGYWGKGLSTTLGSADDEDEVTYARYRRVRYGADAQIRTSIPSVGRTTFKAEVIGGRDATHVRALGYYLLAVQRFGDDWAAFVRLDQFDADIRDAGGLRSVLGGGLACDLSSDLRASIAYEHDLSRRAGVLDQVLTTQLQAVF
ncbi:MAG: hypothetical protein IPK13_12940 [Deltaproteobacteria bacterium]|nr:hypothetical protein [Deltaproteobacteria bacterium]